MARRQRRYHLGQIDDRTEHVPDEGLLCRGYGHRWLRVPASRRQVLQQADKGIVEVVRVCENGCGARWIQVCDLLTFTVIERKREYGVKAYKMKPGAGRLPQAEARKAQMAREFPMLVG